MANEHLVDFLRHLRRLAGTPPEDGTDSQLLARFVAEGDQSAFAALLVRHGPLVRGVCRHVLRDPHEADDAFQATFLVLARKARSIRQGQCLAAWLYRVAYHVAVQANVAVARRRALALRASLPGEEDPEAEILGRELRAVLLEEVDRLPARYRLPVVLSYLEGRTNEETARELGWPVGTVKTRLNRARELLRVRLVRRGLSLSAAVLAALLAPASLTAAVPVALQTAALHAALHAALAPAGSAVAPAVAALAAAAPAAAAKLVTGASVLALAVLTAATGVLTPRPDGDSRALAAAAPVRPPPAAPDYFPPCAGGPAGAERSPYPDRTYAAPRAGRPLAPPAPNDGAILVWDVAAGTLFVLMAGPEGPLLCSGGPGPTVLIVGRAGGKNPPTGASRMPRRVLRPGSLLDGKRPGKT